MFDWARLQAGRMHHQHGGEEALTWDSGAGRAAWQPLSAQVNMQELHMLCLIL